MATHSGVLTWRIPRTEEPGGPHSPWGRKESDTTERLSTKAGVTHQSLEAAFCGESSCFAVRSAIVRFSQPSWEAELLVNVNSFVLLFITSKSPK